MNGQTIIRTGDSVLHDGKKYKVMHVVIKGGQLRLYDVVANLEEVHLFDGSANKKVKATEIKLIK